MFYEASRGIDFDNKPYHAEGGVRACRKWFPRQCYRIWTSEFMYRRTSLVGSRLIRIFGYFEFLDNSNFGIIRARYQAPSELRMYISRNRLGKKNAPLLTPPNTTSEKIKLGKASHTRPSVVFPQQAFRKKRNWQQPKERPMTPLHENK